MAGKTIYVSEPDGNAFAIMGYVKSYLKQTGNGDKIDEVLKEMKSSDYKHLCDVAMAETSGWLEIIDDTDEGE